MLKNIFYNSENFATKLFVFLRNKSEQIRVTEKGKKLLKLPHSSDVKLYKEGEVCEHNHQTYLKYGHSVLFCKPNGEAFSDTEFLHICVHGYCVYNGVKYRRTPIDKNPPCFYDNPKMLSSIFEKTATEKSLLQFFKFFRHSETLFTKIKAIDAFTYEETDFCTIKTNDVYYYTQPETPKLPPLEIIYH